jgi:DNA-binding NarL/FixJ family response regulator
MDKSILVVEDDPAQRRALARQLVRYRIESAATAEAALDRLLGGEPFAAAVIDIGLPGKTGLELLERIRPSRPNLPVVILTAHLDRDAINRASRLCAWYLCKPVNTVELDELIGRACRFDSRAPAINVPAITARYALSPRESEVLTLALEGLRRDVIRQRLGIRETTVKKTVARILRKCSAASLRDIESNPARYAGESEISPPETNPEPASFLANGGKTGLTAESLAASLAPASPLRIG